MAKRPTVSGRKKFGSSRAHGLQLEYEFRRQYPLTKAALEQLHSAVETTVKRNRKGYSRFFVSIQLSVLGGLYQVKFRFGGDDEDPSWEQQWVSTPVVKRIGELHTELDTLLEEVVDFQVANRPARLLRYRVVFLSNKR